MKKLTNKSFSISSLITLLLLLWGMLAGTAQGQIFVSRNAEIGEYSLDGATINASLITVPSSPQGIAINGNDLFVPSMNSGTIGEYTTSGGTVNASLISGR